MVEREQRGADDHRVRLDAHTGNHRDAGPANLALILRRTPPNGRIRRPCRTY